VVSTRGTIEKGPYALAEGKEDGVRKAILDIVNTFTLVYEETKTTTSSFKSLSPSLIQTTHQAVATINLKATKCNTLNLQINNSFTAVESPEFAPINITAHSLNTINQASFLAVEKSIAVYRGAENVANVMMMAAVS